MRKHETTVETKPLRDRCISYLQDSCNSDCSPSANSQQRHHSTQWNWSRKVTRQWGQIPLGECPIVSHSHLFFPLINFGFCNPTFNSSMEIGKIQVLQNRGPMLGWHRKGMGRCGSSSVFRGKSRAARWTSPKQIRREGEQVSLKAGEVWEYPPSKAPTPLGHQPGG